MSRSTHILRRSSEDYARMKADMATDEEYDANEEEACEKSRRAEEKYILRHDAWVNRREHRRTV